MVTVLEPKLSAAAPPQASDRSFGLVFAAVFTGIGLWPLLRLDGPRWWAVASALAFALAGLLRPQLLHPLNRAWLLLGRLLHRIASPLVMSAIFFFAVTPIAWLMRRRGKDVLSLRRRADLASYWIAREPDAPALETMKRQF